MAPDSLFAFLSFRSLRAKRAKPASAPAEPAARKVTIDAPAPTNITINNNRTRHAIQAPICDVSALASPKPAPDAIDWFHAQEQAHAVLDRTRPATTKLSLPRLRTLGLTTTHTDIDTYSPPPFSPDILVPDLSPRPRSPDPLRSCWSESTARSSFDTEYASTCVSAWDGTSFENINEKIAPSDARLSRAGTFGRSQTPHYRVESPASFLSFDAPQPLPAASTNVNVNDRRTSWDDRHSELSGNVIASLLMACDDLELQLKQGQGSQSRHASSCDDDADTTFFSDPIASAPAYNRSSIFGHGLRLSKISASGLDFSDTDAESDIDADADSDVDPEIQGSHESSIHAHRRPASRASIIAQFPLPGGPRHKPARPLQYRSCSNGHDTSSSSSMASPISQRGSMMLSGATSPTSPPPDMPLPLLPLPSSSSSSLSSSSLSSSPVRLRPRKPYNSPSSYRSSRASSIYPPPSFSHSSGSHPRARAHPTPYFYQDALLNPVIRVQDHEDYNYIITCGSEEDGEMDEECLTPMAPLSPRIVPSPSSSSSASSPSSSVSATPTLASAATCSPSPSTSSTSSSGSSDSSGSNSSCSMSSLSPFSSATSSPSMMSIVSLPAEYSPELGEKDGDGGRAVVWSFCGQSERGDDHYLINDGGVEDECVAKVWAH